MALLVNKHSLCISSPESKYETMAVPLPLEL